MAKKNVFFAVKYKPGGGDSSKMEAAVLDNLQ